MIFSNTWTVVLTWSVYFIADKSENLPYSVNWKVLNNTQTWWVILKLLTSKDNLTVTWITIPTTMSEFNTNSQNLLKLWYSLDVIWKEVLWKNYISTWATSTLEECLFWVWNTSWSIFWECSL